MLSTVLKPRFALTVFSIASLAAPKVFCSSDPSERKGPGLEGASWLDKFAKTGRGAVEANLPQDDMFSNSTAREVSLLMHQYFGDAPVRVGYGLLMGYFTGFFVKRASKVIGFAVGGVFAVMQVLAYNGYIVVNHDKLKADTEDMLDLNRDGKIDSEDLKVAYRKLEDVMSYNLPTGGGFGAGLILGLRN